jgi:ribosomal-protein-alanine N-acetyltransferase
VTAAGDIRRARLADLPQLAGLEAAAFADPWTMALVAGELANPGALVLVMDDAAPAAPGTPAATGTPAAPADDDAAPALLGYACFQQIADEAELLRVAVHPARRNQRLGRRLVEAGLAILRDRGVARCHLEVRPANQSARAVYRALGFELAGRRPGYYRDGSDALILSRAL